MTESTKALEAYAVYRDMGPNRSLEAVSKELTKSTHLIRRWSAAHNWVARAAEHDRAISDAAARKDQERRIADADKRRTERLAVASALRGTAVKAMNLMDPEELKKRPYAVVQMFAHADTTERLDTGEATTRTDITSGGQSIADAIRDALTYTPDQ